MGLVHTGIRSKLAVEKVRKTTMVGMDIKRSHREADLLRFRGKRNFTGFNSESEPNAAAQELDHTNFTASDSLNVVDQEDGLMDFDELSETLYCRCSFRKTR